MNPTTKADVRILVLDDEEIITGLIVSLLNDAGYSSVTGFTDPNGAIEHLRRNPVDVIFADFDLRRPDFDGIAFLDAARNVPFKFIFSGYLSSRPELLGRCRRKGYEPFEKGTKFDEKIIQKLDSLFAFHHIRLSGSR